MKKNQLASLALLGLASALVSTPIVANDNTQNSHFAAHGCGSGSCGAQKGPRGQIAENTLPSKDLQNAAAKPQAPSAEEQDVVNKQNSSQGQNHGCAGKKASGAHGCAGASGASHGCGSR